MKYVAVVLFTALILSTLANNCYSGTIVLSEPDSNILEDPVPTTPTEPVPTNPPPTSTNPPPTTTPPPPTTTSCEPSKTCTIFCSSFPLTRTCKKTYTHQIPTSLFSATGCITTLPCNCLRVEVPLSSGYIGNVTLTEYNQALNKYANLCRQSCLGTTTLEATEEEIEEFEDEDF